MSTSFANDDFRTFDRLHLTSGRDDNISFNVLQDSTVSFNLETQLQSINHDFADVSYVCGWIPTTKDAIFFDFCVTFVNFDRFSKWPHLKRWFSNIQSFDQIERKAFPQLEQAVTPLMKKVDRMCNFCLSDRDLIDQKVRWLFAGKQNRCELCMNIRVPVLSLSNNILRESVLIEKLCLICIVMNMPRT